MLPFFVKYGSAMHIFSSCVHIHTMRGDSIGDPLFWVAGLFPKIRQVVCSYDHVLMRGQVLGQLLCTVSFINTMY